MEKDTSNLSERWGLRQPQPGARHHVVDRNISAANAALGVKRICQVGVDRILSGSDAAAGDNLGPRKSWAAFRRLPLTEREFERVARKVAPYLR